MWLFIIFSAFILYTYLGYPLILLLLGITRKAIPPPAPGTELPSLSLLIPVYNEETVIVKKLDNALALDYPRKKLEIVVASDGSTDRTVELVRSYIDQGVCLLEYPENRGKMSVINRAIPELTGELIVFTDASAIFLKDALRFLISGFEDQLVGAVSGALVLKEEEEAGGELSVDLYWRLEKFVRERESRWYSSVGATGAIYALRRKLFRPLPEDTILDDMMIPLGPVQQGYRIRFDSRARALEEGYTDLKLEFNRKVRTLVGNYQVFFRAFWSLIPGKSRVAFQMISHKLFRLLVPFALAGVLISCLLGPTALLPVLFLQIIFYIFAGYGLFLTIRDRRCGKIFSVPLTFCLLNAAALRATLIYFFQRKSLVWK
ncbi:MAG: glycosyltransferase family 2 protein [Candidatus Auribacterota bacterium]|nr:glycosyltransferase family 2 protein [Candidatus Auribacterota bacterium]